ncbi:MAG: hypothetical protein AAFQ42_05080 [Pseudomonadota bacterium]
MPEPAGYRPRAPIDLERLAKRLEKVARLVPSHYPEHRLARVTLSPHDHDRLMVAVDGFPATGPIRHEIAVAGIPIGADRRVLEGTMRLQIERPSRSLAKSVSLAC